jgi:hypothetical protein
MAKKKKEPKRPEKQTKHYYDWRDAVEYMAAKSGNAKKFRVMTESVVDGLELHNDSFFTVDGTWIRDYREDGEDDKADLLTAILGEFGEGEKPDEVEFHYWW